jgi:uncharacterized membrane protein YbhN (UPF0104 family)
MTDVQARDARRTPPSGPQLSAGAKRVLRIAGTILFLVSLTYVGLFAAQNWHAIEPLPRLRLGCLALAAGLYALAHGPSSAAWILSLRAMGQPIPFLTGLKIGLTTQVGKYMPGNVAHYFARAGLAATCGVRVASSGIATLFEILAALIAASLTAAAAVLLDPAPMNAIHMTFRGATTPSTALIAGAVLANVSLARIMKVSPTGLLAAVGCLAINFILAGLSFLAVISAISGTSPSPAAVIGIFTVAWAAGYVVPGAPAGLGVREAILVSWLGPIIGPGPALAGTLLHRMITAGVDALVALAAYGWLRSTRTPHNGTAILIA